MYGGMCMNILKFENRGKNAVILVQKTSLVQEVKGNGCYHTVS